MKAWIDGWLHLCVNNDTYLKFKIKKNLHRQNTCVSCLGIRNFKENLTNCELGMNYIDIYTHTQTHTHTHTHIYIYIYIYICICIYSIDSYNNRYEKCSYCF